MFRALLAGCALLAVAGCGDDRFPDYNYKMTIYAHGQAYSTVRHVQVDESASIVDSGGTSVKNQIEGEAVILDTGSGRPVFALLSRPDNADHAKYVAGWALSPHIPGAPKPGEVGQAIADYQDEHRLSQDSFGRAAHALQAMVQIKGPKELPRTKPNDDPYRGPREVELWPQFVTFADPADPTTVRAVSPDEIGVERITIEITDEPVTTGIEARLPSFGPETGFREWYRTIPVGDPRQITKSAFGSKD